MQQHIKLLFHDSSLKRKEQEGCTEDVSYHVSILIVLLLLPLYPPIASWFENLGISLFECPFRKMTGLLCPFCGTTTQVRALIHGNIRLSVPVIFLLFTYAAEVIKHLLFLVLLYKKCGEPLTFKVRIADILTTFLTCISIAFVFFASCLFSIA